MAHKTFAVAFSLIVAASPALAQPAGRDEMTGAPAAGSGARYCLRVAADTGSLVERIRCWTREQWVDQGVDVDKEWAKEGVSVVE
jgi:hypothetical protein